MTPYFSQVIHQFAKKFYLASNPLYKHFFL